MSQRKQEYNHEFPLNMPGETLNTHPVIKEITGFRLTIMAMHIML